MKRDMQVVFQSFQDSTGVHHGQKCMAWTISNSFGKIIYTGQFQGEWAYSEEALNATLPQLIVRFKRENEKTVDIFNLRYGRLIWEDEIVQEQMKIEINIDSPANVNTEEVAKELAKLFSSLNKAHICMGGQGLVIDE